MSNQETSSSEDDQLPWLARFPDRDPMPIVEVDRTGRIRHLNPAAERLFPDLRQKGPAHPWLADWDSAVRSVETAVTPWYDRVVAVGGTVYRQWMFLAEPGRVRIQGVDITEHRRAEESLRVQSSAALEWSRARDSVSVLRVLAEKIYSVADGAIVLVSEFDPGTNQTIVRSLQCTPDERQRAIAVLGRDPVGLTLDFPDDVRRRWVAGELAPIPSLHDLTFRQVPVDVCERLVQELGLGKMFGMVCAYERNILGSVAVVLRGEPELKAKGAIETLVAGAALALQRIRADRSLRESEERLRRTQEISQLGSWELDLTHNRLLWSDEVYRIFGLVPGQFAASYEAFLEAVHPEDRAAVDATYSGSLREGKDTYEIEHRIVRRSTGEVRFVHEKCEHLRDASGRVVKSLGMVHDITERRRAEQALRKSEERFRTVADNAQDSIARFDREGRFLYVNPFTTRLVGRPVEAVLGKTNEQLDRNVGAESCEARVREVFDSGKALRFDRRSVDGRWFDVQLIPEFRCGVVETVLSVARDITERRRAEDERDRLAEQRQLALDAARLGWWHYDPVTRIARYDARYTEIFGVSGHQRPNEEILKLLHPDDLPRVWAAVEAALDPADPRPYSTEYRVNRRDGAMRWVEAHGMATFEGEGPARRAINFVGTVADVTDRRRQEELGRAIDSINQLVHSTLDCSEILDRAVAESARAIGCDTAAVALRDDAGWRVAYTYGLGGTAVGTEMLDDEEPHALLAIQIGEPVPIADAFDDPRVNREHMHERGIRSELVIPLAARDEPLGVMFLDWSRSAITFRPYHIDFASRLASTLSLALENARLFGELQQELGERKRVHEHLRDLSQQLAYHIDHSPLAVIEWGPDMRLKRWSGAAERLFGWKAQEVLGKRMEDFRWIYEEDEAHVAEVSADLCQGTNLRRFSANRNYRKDGSVVHCEWYNSSLLDESGKLRSILSLVLDVTEREQAEAALRKANALLLDADRRKTEFLAMLSHELRNPLAPISNSLFVLDHAVPGGEQASRARAIVTRQVAQLTKLVDELLDVTRFTSGKLRLQMARFDLVQMLLRTAEDHKAMFEGAGIAFDVRTGARPLWVDGDEARMAQVVGNLLANSAKFTKRGGQVTLELAEDAPDGQAVMRVRDTGAGIDPDLLPDLFEPFVQADHSLDRSQGGLGLGLALVKGIVQAHGGRVEARSGGPGTGAELVVWLPAERGAARAERRSQPPSRPPPRRVLVIEDNEDTAESLRNALELGEHRVQVAHTGLEGLRLAKELEPEVVLCDIGLPGMSGYDVARALRADESLRSVKLVALTGYALPEDERLAAEAGFDRHVPKPPSIEQIEDLLADLPSHA